MLKIERKLIEFVEKHLFLLCILLVSLLALYLRKIAVWWNYEEMGSYFDMHPNYTQTVTYWLVVRLMQYLPMLPLHSVKWLAGLADFGVAGMVAWLLGREADSGKRLIFYAVTLFSPVLFLRGIIWAQPDSVAVLLLLVAYALFPLEKRRWLALVLITGAIVLCPWLSVIALFYLWRREEGQKNFWLAVLFLTLGGLAVQFVSALLVGVSWKECFFTGMRFLTYNPESGVLYADAGEWLLWMIYQYSPVAAVLTILAAGKNKISCAPAILTQIVAAVLYGAHLF